MNFLELAFLFFIIVLAFYSYYQYLFYRPRFKMNFSNQPLFLRLIRTSFFKPGFLVNQLSNEDPLKLLMEKAACPYGMNFNDIMHIQELFLLLAELYVLIRLWFVGGFLIHLFLYLFLAFLLFHLPLLWLKSQAAQRSREFDSKLAPSIDLLIMAVEAGMNLEYAIEHVSKFSSNIVSNELARASKEIAYGLSIAEALEGVRERIDNEDFSRFVILVKQAKDLGVSLGKTLRIQAELIRNRKRQRAEELARTASIKIMFPLVFCIFPALLILYLSPALIQFFQIR